MTCGIPQEGIECLQHELLSLWRQSLRFEASHQLQARCAVSL
jgi:hypothetical protein